MAKSKIVKSFCTLHFAFCILIYIISNPGFSQGEFNNWYFGNKAGVTFNSGAPVFFPSSMMINDVGGYINISDSLGNILFYGDISGIYNRNNASMTNGGGIGNCAQNFDKTIIAFQWLNDINKYYIVSGGCGAIGLYSGLKYSIVDMTLDGGLGAIPWGMNSLLIPGGERAYTAVTATRHHNNHDIWFVVRLRDTDSNFYSSYQVTSAGINFTPVLSNSRLQLYTPPAASPVISIIRISRDGTKIAVVYNTIIEFGNFNSNNGQITPLFLVPLPICGVNHIRPQSVEFSIDSKYLYVSGVGISSCPLPSKFLYQFDATLTDSAQFANSAILINNQSVCPGLQFAPDQKIYCTEGLFVDSLSVINNPSLPGTGCNYQSDVLNLNGRYSGYELPDYVERYYAIIHHTGQCQGQIINFTSAIWPPPDSIHWDFGDFTSVPSNFSNLPNPIHIYSNTGTYTIELFVRHIDNRTDTSWKTITILASPQVVLGTDRTICAGDSTTFDAGVCSGCTYLWKDLGSGLTVGINQTFRTDVPGTYAVTVTNSNNCIGSDTIQLQTTPVPLVTNNPLSNSICSGESTNIPLTSNVSGTMFHWTASLTSGNISGFGADSGLVINQTLVNSLSTDGIVTYHITPKVGSCAGSTVDFPVTVNPAAIVSIGLTASATDVCDTTNVYFQAFPVNGGSTGSIQWKINGIIVPGNSIYYTYIPSDGDVVTCVLTSSLTECVTNNPATSNAIALTVHPMLPVSVFINASQNPYCQGNAVNFTATPTNGGTSPSYLWKVNGIIVGTNNPVYSYIPNNGDLVKCVVNSNIACPTGNPATSSTITMVENTVNPVSVVITTPITTVCSGTPVTFSAATMYGGPTPSFQWKVNGINTGSNNSQFTYTPVNGDCISCILTSNLVCASGNPATSNSICMTVNPNLPVTISISTPVTTVCAGTQVTFTSATMNGGPAPFYQWKINGVNAGTNNPVYSYIPVNGDIIKCVVTSDTICPTGNPATSNQITMTVNPNLPVSITISASLNPVCSGIPVIFTSATMYGGPTPFYQWKVDGANVGSNSSTYTYNPVSGDQILCILTSNIACPIGNPATSNIISMNVATTPVVTFTRCNDSITITTGQPFKLKGGIPLGGIYSGPGVSNGILYPAIAGVGTKAITFSYTNAASCSATATLQFVIRNPAFLSCGSDLTDIRDNKLYHTIQIGSQCWLAEDLNYGIEINSNTDQRDNCMPEKYHNPASSIQHPASVYQWDEIMNYDQTVSTQGLCPPGWHVPTEADWNTLFANYTNNGFAASPLKYSGFSGFNALLSGAYHMNKTWDWPGFATFFWSSTAHGATKALAHGLNDIDPSVSLYPSQRSNAFSVRCIKDN